MFISKGQIDTLKPYIKNLMEMIKGDDVQILLDAIDNVIIDNILKNNDEPDEEGVKLQKIYDEIYNKN